MPLDISREFGVRMYKYMHHKALSMDTEATFIGFLESWPSDNVGVLKLHALLLVRYSNCSRFWGVTRTDHSAVSNKLGNVLIALWRLLSLIFDYLADCETSRVCFIFVNNFLSKTCFIFVYNFCPKHVSCLSTTFVRKIFYICLQLLFEMSHICLQLLSENALYLSTVFVRNMFHICLQHLSETFFALINI